MIRYAALTFPEVDRLPRDLPLVLPLEPFPEGTLEPPPGPAEWGLLPCVPYGLAPPLKLPEALLVRLLNSILATLREDGFHHLEVTSHSPPPSGLQAPWRAQTHPPQPPDLPDQPLILVPIGHTEQHGFHLPLSTDTVLIEAIARGAAALEARAGCLPVWPYGVSMHRRQYPGTLSCDPRAFEDLWVSLCERLGGWGCQAVYLMNGHGGNGSFLVNAVKFAGDRSPRPLVATSFLHTSSGAAWRTVAEQRRSGLMGHACELETSMMLFLRPDLVHLERAVDETDFGASSEYAMDWVEEGALVINPPWTDDTRTGTYGAPSLATAEHGRQWLEAGCREAARLAGEILAQAALREERRRQGWVEGAWRSYPQAGSTSPEPRPPR